MRTPRWNRIIVSCAAFLCAACAHASDPREPLDDAAFEPGTIVSLPTEDHPLVEHEIVLDTETANGRIYGGAQLRITAAQRTLRNERMKVRLPEDPEDPAADRPPRGVLLWVHAASPSVIPGVFVEAADRLNLVIVAPANVGNKRPILDRMQVCLDAIATVQAYVPTDNSRVYVTGISGGGRVSSMLHVCFPDVFNGSVPIVGVNCYASTRSPDGARWPAGMSRPSRALWRLLRDDRIAPITGPRDFNHDQTEAAVERFARDGLDARSFSYPDQEHTMPTAPRFAEAMSWVNEAWQTTRDERVKEAEEGLEAVRTSMARLGRNVPSAAHRRRLARVIETAPWSAPADQARALLREPDTTEPAENGT